MSKQICQKNEENTYVCEACAFMTFNCHEEYMEHNRKVHKIYTVQ